MGLSHFLTALLPLLGNFPTDVGGPILFTLRKGNSQKAFENYINYTKETKNHDFDLLQEAAKSLLEAGINSNDPEIQLLSIFGAGVAASPDMLPILERGIHSNDPRTQLVALSYLSKQDDDIADELLLEALSSPFLGVRLEVLFHLAQKNHPAVLNHLYSLSVKVPDVVRTVFGQIAVLLEGGEAFRYVQKLLNDPDTEVRTATILAVADAKRDDFLPIVHGLSMGTSCAQLEAAALALGAFKDQSACARLKSLAKSPQENVKLAALTSLFELGHTDFLGEIEEEAKNQSLLAINILGKLKEGKETLYKLLTHQDRDVRLNAILALLEQNDARVVNFLEEVVIEDGRDIGFWRFSSLGGGLHSWKTIPSAKQQTKSYPELTGQTLNLREQVLLQCLEFDEKDFLKIAQIIFEKKQHALVPLTVELLQNKKSDAVIQFLKEWHQKAGAPLIRNYCTLALYQLKVEGPYESQLASWVKEKGGAELIRFREGKEKKVLNTSHQLTPEETSGFLVAACQSLAESLDASGIDVLLHAIAYGNPKNRYALAGLLLRTTE